MLVKVQILTEETNSYQGARGFVSLQRLTCLDTEPKARFKQTFDFDLEGEDKAKWTGKLTGKTVVLGVTDFAVFGGRFRAKGNILEVEGAAVTK